MNARIPLVSIAFFLSGAAALIYQVTWQRLLALHSGVGIYSVAMIVAAFMVGLGLGSHLGGVLSVRLPPRTALLAFATLELAIGFFGLASGRLYYDWLYLRAGGLYATPWRAAILHFVSPALPTILMGMSLPLLVRAMVRDAPHAARPIGLLYGVNVLGACPGAPVTPWGPGRSFGVREALSRAGRLRRLVVVFLAWECALLASSAVAILALVLMPPRTPFFAWFFELWGGHRSYNLGGAWSWPPVWRLYVLLPLVLYGLPTV